MGEVQPSLIYFCDRVFCVTFTCLQDDQGNPDMGVAPLYNFEPSKPPKCYHGYYGLSHSICLSLKGPFFPF